MESLGSIRVNETGRLQVVLEHGILMIFFHKSKFSRSYWKDLRAKYTNGYYKLPFLANMREVPLMPSIASPEYSHEDSGI